ncbi:MAG TPA: SRPBCC domain-containing protein [Fimbriimonas sp.]
MKSASLLSLSLLAASCFADLEPITAEATVDAPVAEVWRAWTTSKGAEAWMVAHAEIEMKVGGIWRTHYSKDGRIGDPGTIENELLAFDPERMFAIRIKKVPERFPFKSAFRDMWTVVYLDPVGTDRTKVTVRGMGFKDDEESKKMRAFFEAGNKYELDVLVKHFERK